MKRIVLFAAAILVAAAPARGEDRRLWAVLVGIDKYDDETIPVCRDSLGNVVLLESWLRGSQGDAWVSRGLLEMVDGGQKSLRDPEQPNPRLRPSGENLKSGLLKWLKSRVRPGDVVLFYFSGHATGVAPDPDRKRPREMALLMPSDARAHDPQGSGVDLSAIFDDPALRECEVIYALETSLQGHGPSGWKPAGQDAFVPDFRPFLQGLTRHKGRTAWLASGGDPSPVEGVGNASRGAFTLAMAKALGPAGPFAPSEDSGLMDVLNRLQRDLAAQGFQSMGRVPSRLGLRRDELKRRLEPPTPEMVVQRGHIDRLSQVAVTADGATLVTAGADGKTKVWDMADRSLSRSVGLYDDPIQAIALSDDGELVMVGDSLGRIVLHETRGKLSRPVSDRGNAVERLLALPGEPARFAGRLADGSCPVWTLHRTPAPNPTLSFQSVTLKSAEGAEIRALDIAVARAPTIGAASLAALGTDGRLTTFNVAGRVLQTIPFPQIDPDTLESAFLAMAEDGRSAVVATGDGTLHRVDLTGRVGTPPRRVGTKISGITMNRNGLIAVMVDKPDPSLVLVRDRGLRVLTTLAHEYPVASWSEDGSILAAARLEAVASGARGRIDAWRIADDGTATAIALQPPPGRDDSSVEGIPASLSLAHGRLIAGLQSGGAIAWDLPVPLVEPVARHAFDVDSGWGKLDSLATHPSKRVIVGLDSYHRAWRWDLGAGGGPVSLPGRWHSASILDDGRIALVVHHDDIERPGEVVLMSPEGDLLPERFALPGEPGELRLDLVEADPTGEWLAAASTTFGGPVIVYSAKTGEIKHEFADPDRRGVTVSALAFSQDGRRLLILESDGDAAVGQATVRDLGDPGAKILHDGPFQVRDSVNGKFFPTLTAGAFDPLNADQFVVGVDDGRIFQGNVKTGEWARVAEMADRVAVTGLAFSPDGQHLLAGFAESRLLLMDRGANGKLAASPTPVAWRHNGRVTDVIAIANPLGSLFVTSGEDGAVRLWNPDPTKGKARNAEVGTLLAWDPTVVTDGSPSDRASLQWLAFTPEGAFDGPPLAARFLRRVGSKVESPEQAARYAHRPGLARRLAEGETVALGPEPWPDNLTPPRLTIDAPDQPVVEDRVSDLLLRFDGDIDPASLRLYQNGLPIPLTGLDGQTIDRAEPAGTPIRVTLRRGANTFYAMASGKDTPDGRSADVEVFSTAPEPPGRLHVLALGVGDYPNRRLKFARDDAEAMATRLPEAARNAGAPDGGLVRVLPDGEVSRDNIHSYFIELEKATRGRPEDSVVVFIAGHTAVAGKDERFSLLTPDYPFQAEPGGQVVARRGPDEDDRVPMGKGVLPMSEIYGDLVRMGAMNRLVIVDGCSARAVLTDASIRKIQEVTARYHFENRVSYVLASQDGPSAFEAEDLRHGLLTYSLLRGILAPEDVPPPQEVRSIFARYDTGADLNHDSLTTTDELQAFADRTVPPLIALVNKSAPRGDQETSPSQVSPRRGGPSFPILMRLSGSVSP